MVEPAPHKDYLGLTSEISHYYGQMKLQVVKRSEIDTKVYHFVVSLGSHRVDISNLPTRHPARTRNGRDLSIYISNTGAFSSEYDSEKHSLKFDTFELKERTFPINIFEELKHAELSDEINSLLTRIDRSKGFPQGLPIELIELPVEVQRVIFESTEELAEMINDPNHETEKSKAKLAKQLVHEYITTQHAIKELYEWCDRDIGKVGLTDALVAEYVLLCTVDKANNEDQLKYWKSDFLVFPPYQDFYTLKQMIQDRIWYLSHGKNAAPDHPGERSFLPEENISKFFTKYGL